MNTNQAKKILAILSPLWPKGTLDETLIPAWAIAIHGLDSEVLQVAAVEWLRTPGQKFMPRPGELIALAADIEHQQPRQALPAPKKHRPSEEYIRRVYATCQKMGVDSPAVNAWYAELESERVS